jgi:uncharacterized membrane protein
MMRGPIDYIIVGFEGNKFDGSILKALADSIEKGVINLIDLAVVMRDKDDKVSKVEISELGEKNCAAGLLVIEQLWAKPLKQALLNANGILLAEGRIHPEAALELNTQ